LASRLSPKSVMSGKPQLVVSQRQTEGSSEQALKTCVEPAKRGASIKPGVELNPRIVISKKIKAGVAGDSRFIE